MILELFIIGAMSSSPRSTPSVRSSTPSSTSHSSTPSNTSRPSTPTGSKTNYKIGKSPLVNSLKVPAPHQYNGLTYSSSAAQYTNIHGLWVFWWLMYTNEQGNDELRCYDEKHERTPCDRDDESWQKEWAE